MRPPLPLKDDSLADLASHFNVAAFFSIRSGETAVRHLHLAAGAVPRDVESAIDVLLQTSAAGTVNVRSFSATRSKGMPFTYGIATRDEVLATIRSRFLEGLDCIVNETIDTKDGGVSGVSLGGVVEVVPDDTPRGVESDDVASVDLAIARHVLRTVYGEGVELPVREHTRIEFSVHPGPVGVRREQVVVWEAEAGELDRGVNASNLWPNRFSRMIGDKTYGLMVADALGCDVPETLVISRRVAPFRFGQATGGRSLWVRTAPSDQAQGKFTTLKGWVDIFALLEREDPGMAVAAVLRQDGVEGEFSGAAYSLNGEVVIEGVGGDGDEFMLGGRGPSELPPLVTSEVGRVMDGLRQALRTDVSVEWAIRDSRVWILQLHAVEAGLNSDLVLGNVNSWASFDPNDGLSALRELIQSIEGRNVGVLVTRPVGRTSHVGDLLRANNVVSRFSNETPT